MRGPNDQNGVAAGLLAWIRAVNNHASCAHPHIRGLEVSTWVYDGLRVRAPK